jgi:hypothetical protein
VASPEGDYLLGGKQVFKLKMLGECEVLFGEICAMQISKSKLNVEEKAVRLLLLSSFISPCPSLFDTAVSTFERLFTMVSSHRPYR